MSYDKDKYQKLRSLNVPRDLALALADDASPITGGGVAGPGFTVLTQAEESAELDKQFDGQPSVFDDLEVGSLIFVYNVNTGAGQWRAFLGNELG